MEKAKKKVNKIEILIIFLATFVGGLLIIIPAKSSFENFKSSKVASKETSILFVGDIMLDRGVRNVMEQNYAELPFEGVKELLKSTDLTVGNLEGTLTDNPSIAQKDNSILRFTFDPKLSATLRDLGFDGFSLANNHALDFYQAGFESTKGLLEENQLFYFGSPVNTGKLSHIVTKGEEKLCFIGYHLSATTHSLSKIRRRL
jgi:poly-gamma-glutamate capsule biosynthesis protein CapA/YwtB (metallophosphatase superfamily)